MKRVRLEGTIVHAGHPFSVRPKPRSLIGFVVGVLLFPIVLVVLVTFRVVGALTSPSNSGPRGDIVSDVIAWFVANRLFQRRPDVPCRDYRLRDHSRVERAIRVTGDFVGGDMVVGDNVELDVVDRHGTFQVLGGRNRHTGARIIVRHR